MNGTLSNVEIKEHKDKFFLQLNRTGEWSNVTPAVSPPPRKGHSMVFDDGVNATVLFGGRNETTYFSDTWLYFSGNNTWVEVTPSGSPTPREGHAMAFDRENDLIIMFGGYDGSNYLFETWTYSASGNVWMSLNPASHPPARAWTAMSYDKVKECIILFGGLEQFQQTGDTWQYELSGNAWTPLFPFSNPRERHGHSMVYSESLGLHILTGGYVVGGEWSDTWVFNSTAVMWVSKPLGSDPMPRSNHSLVYDSVNEEVYLFGGHGNASVNNGEDRFTILPCAVQESDLATTVLEYDGHIFIGTSNISNQAKIFRYDPTTDACMEWQDTGVFYVYSSGSYGGVAFWGSRRGPLQTDGPLFYYDGTTFGSIPATTWFSTLPAFSGWVQDFELFKGRMFVSGSTMMGVPQNDNNFFVKYCDNPPCLSGGDWHWTDTSTANIGLLDDALDLQEFNGELYLSTYDWASVLKYYESNNTWWYVLNGSVDGNTPGMKGGYGIYGLANYSGELHALTYAFGWHWTTQDGVSWVGVNESLGSYTRALAFEDRMYSGLLSTPTNYLGSFYGSSWSFVASSSGNFLYLTEIGNKLYVSIGNQVLRREAYHNDFWEYRPQFGNWVEMADVGPPTDLERFAMTYDSLNNVIILFGGTDESRYYNQTYIYDRTVGSGVFTSASFDSGNTPLLSHWDSISWSRTSQPSGSSISFQIATNNDISTWMYKGPDGTAGSYYSSPLGEDVWSGHDGDRYLRFRAYFSTTSPVGPILESVKIGFGHTPAQPLLEEPLDDIWTNDNSPRFSWAFDDFDPGDHQSGFQVLISDDLSFVSIAFDSGDQDSTNEFWQLPSTLLDGVWYWKVRTKDADDIWGEFSQPFTLKIDMDGPSSRTSNLTSDSHLSAIAFFNGTSNDTHSGVGLNEILLTDEITGDYWDGSVWQSQEQWHPTSGTERWTFDTISVNWISEREYSITTRATDNAGNVEVPTESTSFIYDSTSPTVTMINPLGSESPEGGEVIEIEWTATDAYLNQSSIAISYSNDGGTNWNSIAEAEPNDGSYNWTLPPLKMDARIRVEAEDLAGNIGSDMSGVFYVRAPERDKKRSVEPEEEAGPPPIVATAGETTLCAVCLGTVKEGLSVIKCGECGKTFHEKCAARIEKCPNCDAKLDMSEIEEE
jgi:hypothetical protein